MAALEKDLFAEINVVRARRGLRLLRQSARLRAAAEAHSIQMAQVGYFEHASADGTPFWRRIARFYPARGFSDWAVGENLESGSQTLAAHETVTQWLNSPPHRENLLDRDWREAGVGAVFSSSAPGYFRGAPTVLVTLDLGYRHR